MAGNNNNIQIYCLYSIALRLVFNLPIGGHDTYTNYLYIELPL